ncbi:MAG TPA: hypothetical protein VFA88_03155 [Gaiellaceae bacterium]|nr:hypothetical protein [Gaiellaceae bacterium]
MNPRLPSEPLTARQIAETEATFREANEGINAAAEEFAFDALIPFICECALLACTEIVPLTRPEYEAVRASSVTFVVVPGHEIIRAGGGRIQFEHERYDVVEKLGESGEIAADLDPRA